MKPGKVPFITKLRPEMKHDVQPDRKGRGQMLLPTPMLVAQEVAAVPEGSLVTMSDLRTRLAAKFDADITCPLMAGIFFGIIAGAAEEQIRDGVPPIAPYWRVVQDDGTLSQKTPYGSDRHAEHLTAEGHTVVRRGVKLHVADYQQRISA